jgi:hypothetical protein
MDINPSFVNWRESAVDWFCMWLGDFLWLQPQAAPCPGSLVCWSGLWVAANGPCCERAVMFHGERFGELTLTDHRGGNG